MRFRLVDKILEIEKGKRALGLKMVSYEEGMLARELGFGGEIPPLLLLEAVAQLSAWLVLYTTDFRRYPIIGKIERAGIDGRAGAGDSLVLHCVIRGMDDDGVVVDGEVEREGQRIAWGTNCLAALTDAGLLWSRDDLEAEFLSLRTWEGRREVP